MDCGVSLYLVTFYAGLGGVMPRRATFFRCLNESASLDHHRQHPLVELLRKQEIRVKSRRAKYMPSFFVSNRSGQLPAAEFHPMS
jgi:hypothetical protein